MAPFKPITITGPDPDLVSSMSSRLETLNSGMSPGMKKRRLGLPHLLY
jgi:hypothetical protein